MVVLTHLITQGVNCAVTWCQREGVLQVTLVYWPRESAIKISHEWPTL